MKKKKECKPISNEIGGITEVYFTGKPDCGIKGFTFDQLRDEQNISAWAKAIEKAEKGWIFMNKDGDWEYFKTKDAEE
jgi:hypothetical protein